MEKEILINPGAKIAILGLGISGRAAARYALHCGAEVFVSDRREQQQFLSEEAKFLAETKVSWEAGGHSHEYLAQAELLLVSPGVDLQLPLLQNLRGAGVMIAGELAVVAGQIKVPLVAVTGTNGKTTVTTLIGEILKRAGKRVFVGGNIGTPLYEYLMNPAGYDVVVAEVSSFQLESAGKFSPDVGMLLNVTPDHLDRHGNMANYLQAKMQLFTHMPAKSLAIIDGDDQNCQKLAGKVRPFVQSFGEIADCAALIADNLICLQSDGKGEKFCLETGRHADSIALKNYAAASLGCRFLGCSKEQIQAGLDAFEVPPHRMEFVAEIDEVAYYNDSKATNTGAVIAALNQFEDNQVILLAGGRDKGDDYRLLRESVSSRVKKLVLIGEAAPLLSEALSDIVDIFMAETLQAAVLEASKDALPGDVVILSPACASFDMFTSYGHRGQQFKKMVMAIPTAKAKTNARQNA